MEHSFRKCHIISVAVTRRMTFSKNTHSWPSPATWFRGSWLRAGSSKQDLFPCMRVCFPFSLCTTGLLGKNLRVMRCSYWTTIWNKNRCHSFIVSLCRIDTWIRGHFRTDGHSAGTWDSVALLSATWGYKEEVSSLQPGQGPSSEHGRAGTLSSGVQPPEQHRVSEAEPACWTGRGPWPAAPCCCDWQNQRQEQRQIRARAEACQNSPSEPNPNSQRENSWAK